MQERRSSGKRVLLTGGAGFIGSACLRSLLAHGYDPIAFDNLSQGHRDALPEGRLVVGDVADTESLVDALRWQGTDAVMHFAAATCVGESVKDPDFHYANNVLGSASVLRAMRRAGVKRILFSGTCAVYGAHGDRAMDETVPRLPESPYARTKATVEWMIDDFAAAYGLGYTVLRYFNAVGADPDGSHGEDHRPETHLIPLVLKCAAGQAASVQVFGTDYPTRDGTCVRDYVHVLDLAEAHRLALEATCEGTRAVHNVGTGQGHSVRDVIQACQDVTGLDLQIVESVRRAGDPPSLVADSTKIQRVLGWKPKYSDIRTSIAHAWAWHRRNPYGYDR